MKEGRRSEETEGKARDGMHFNFIHLQSLHNSHQILADAGNGSARKGEPTFAHIDDLRNPFLYSLYTLGTVSFLRK